MAGFVNPFAQVGDYQTQRVVHDDLVTTGYLTGLPDPREIQDQHAALIFRTMLKRDTRTKQRALGELEQWIDGLKSDNSVEEVVHLAYVQMYAKLSIDAAPLIRVQSHAVLAKLYTLLGKRSSKYLKYSVGPWIAATNDPDPRAAIAAKDALERVFPGEKQAVLLDRLKDNILEFVHDSCTEASAKTLSDERYVSIEDASQKYTRLVKCCIDVLARVPGMFDLDSENVESLVGSGRLWKFYSSADSSLARSTLQLTAAHVDELEPYIDKVWHELLRAGRKNSGGSGVAIEIVQLMNVLTRKFPDIIWPVSETVRKDSFVSLAQFVAADPPPPARFWPLLYNLVLMVPDTATRDLTPLYKPLEKVVMKLRHDHELERSAWGCFISLAGKMGPEYVLRTFKAAEQRCKGKSVPSDILATFLTRIADAEGVHSLILSQLQDTRVPFAYCCVIARTKLFRADLEKIIVPRVDPEQLVLLVDADPDLSLPDFDGVTAADSWVAIAAKSNKVNSQSIIENCVVAGQFIAVLEHSGPLSARGVRVSVDRYISVNDDATPAAVLGAAVRAHGVFVSRETAISSFKALVKRAVDSFENAKDMFRVVKENQEFVNSIVASDADVKHDLETLRSEDRLEALQLLPAMGGLSLRDESKTETLAAQTLSELRIDALDLSVPLLRISALRAPLPLSSKSTSQGFADCEILFEKLTPIFENPRFSVDEVVILAILRSLAQHWQAAAPKGKPSACEGLMKAMDEYLLEEFVAQDNGEQVWQKLWDLTAGSKYGIAYHAATALSRPTWAKFFKAECYSKQWFTKPSLRGALATNLRIVSGNNEFENIQRSLTRRALAHNLNKQEWMLVDRSFIPESASFTLSEHEIEDIELSSIILETIQNVDTRSRLAFEPQNAVVQLSALAGLDCGFSVAALLDAAVRLPIERTEFDKALGWKLLTLLHADLKEHPESDIEKWQAVQSLLGRRDSDALPWVALLVARAVRPAQLTLDIDHASGAVTRADVVSWLIHLNYSPAHQTSVSHESHSRILDFVARGLRDNGELVDRANIREPPPLPRYKFQNGDCDGNLLYQMCVQHGSDVREWYRGLRDRQTQKYVDSALSTYIVPEIVSSIKTEIDLHPRTDSVEVSVNRKQREVRATREVEDEFTVEVVITLPEQYPGRPAAVEIRNLAGVSEAKKRGWLLEARQTVQNDGVLKALDGVLTRLNNFLEGVEPCAICYMTVNDANKLPNKECGQCHNIYHTDCLFKWFSNNTDRLCPMCRSPM